MRYRFAMNNSPYLTETESVIKALSSLEPGESYIYFVGFLDEERIARPEGSACVIADAAYQLAMADKVHLTQERRSPPTSRGEINWHLGCGKGFKYIATGAKQKRKIGL